MDVSIETFVQIKLTETEARELAEAIQELDGISDKVAVTIFDAIGHGIPF